MHVADEYRTRGKLTRRSARFAAPTATQKIGVLRRTMDEIIHHCLRELAFDGDFGELLLCRLHHSRSTRHLLPRRRWVQGFDSRSPAFFHPHFLSSRSRRLTLTCLLGCAPSRLRDFVSDFYTNHSSSQAQKLDDAFYAFIWSVIVQQPGVRVGKLPQQAQADVYVAPDENTRRKGGVKQQKEDVADIALAVIDDAAVRSLDDLVAEHGDQLRIATDPDRVSMALIGSHIRVISMSM